MARDGYGCRDAGGARARCEAILAADAAMIPPRLGRQLDMNVLWYCDRGSVVVLACLRGARLRCAHSSAAAPAALVVRLIHCNAVVDEIGPRTWDSRDLLVRPNEHSAHDNEAHNGILTPCGIARRPYRCLAQGTHRDGVLPPVRIMIIV